MCRPTAPDRTCMCTRARHRERDVARSMSGAAGTCVARASVPEPGLRCRVCAARHCERPS
eukprot:5695062-Prymnesium_polylepis.1